MKERTASGSARNRPAHPLYRSGCRTRAANLDCVPERGFGGRGEESSGEREQRSPSWASQRGQS